MLALKSILKTIWDCMSVPRPQTLEEYIKSKEPQSVYDVEFWTAEYDNRQRMITRCLANGDVTGANWIRNNY